MNADQLITLSLAILGGLITVSFALLRYLDAAREKSRDDKFAAITVAITANATSTTILSDRLNAHSLSFLEWRGTVVGIQRDLARIEDSHVPRTEIEKELHGLTREVREVGRKVDVMIRGHAASRIVEESEPPPPQRISRTGG